MEATTKTVTSDKNIFILNQTEVKTIVRNLKSSQTECFSASCGAVALYYTTEKHMHTDVQIKQLMISQQVTTSHAERPLATQKN